ncbi:hypothetical protein BB560_005732 [Smittium megazygosporum]|uniref:Methylmalonyl-CoA epimerase, mitochondrial n=1 Tax=Smittium megazygosporum TaxID=133381 RepID=A0A2T9YZ77_9FUNG|nr:hypothetical protein BB560_005732 [Smittium megazygosporum]
MLPIIRQTGFSAIKRSSRFLATTQRLSFSTGMMLKENAKTETPGAKFNYMQLGTLNHVAIATKDANKAKLFYETVLGANPANISEKIPQEEHGVYTVFISLGNTKIELLEPLGEKSPILKFLEANPNGGIHHICINVKDINKAVEQVKANNVRTLGNIKIGAHGLPVIFLHPKDCLGVLIELEESKH